MRRGHGTRGGQGTRGGTVIIPTSVFKNHPSLKKRDTRELYITLMGRVSKHSGRGIITRKEIQKITKWHPDRISRVLGHLCKEGLVHKKFLGPKGLSIFLPEYMSWEPTPGTFTLLPRKILLNKSLSLRARLVYALMYWYTYSGKRKYIISLERLEKETGFSQRSLIRYLSRLKSAGILASVKRKYLPNSYTISSSYRKLGYHTPSPQPTYRLKTNVYKTSTKHISVEQEIQLNRYLRAAGYG